MNAIPAFYIPSDISRAFKAQSDNTLNLKNARGQVVDQIPMIAGEWLVIEDGKPETYGSDDEFYKVYCKIPGAGSKSFIRKATAQILEQPLDGEEASEWKQRYFRCDKNGLPLCSANLPLGIQAGLLGLSQDNADARVHMAVLRQSRDLFGKGPIWDPQVQADVTAFDLMSAGFNEDSSEEAKKDYQGMDPDAVPEVISEFCQENGAPYLEWIAMKQFWLSQLPAIKVLQERLLGCYTDIPVGSIQMSAVPSSEFDSEFDEFVRTLREKGDVRPVEKQPDFTNLAPGYQAETEILAANGIEYLLVEDVFGKYLYAWPDVKNPYVPKLDF